MSVRVYARKSAHLLTGLLALVSSAAHSQVQRIEVRPGPEGSFPASLVTYTDALYFTAFDGGYGRALFRFAEPEGTTVVPDFGGPLPAVRIVGSPSLGVYDGALFFGAASPTGDEGLYQYRKGGNVSLVADIAEGSDSSPSQFIEADGILYFTASIPATGNELFRYTPSGGVSLVADVYPGDFSSSISDLTVSDDTLYFRGGDASRTGYFRYSPSGGVEILTDLGIDVVGGDLGMIAEFDGALYLSGSGSGSGMELYRYSHEEGAVLVADIDDVGSSTPRNLSVQGGALYFTASTPSSGRELFRYTPSEGAVRLTDISPGEDSSFPLFEPTDIVALDGAIYFRAIGPQGAEFYRYTDDEGTILVADINPTGSSDPSGLIVYDGAVYFSADDGASGRELYRYLPPTSTSTSAPGPIQPSAMSVWPSPTAGAAKARVTIEPAQHVRLSVYDALGRLVLVGLDEDVSGPLEVTLHLGHLKPGPYLVRVVGETFVGVQAVTVAR